MKKKLVVLSGPSCVGKGPLRAALPGYYKKKTKKDLKYAELVVCNSRRPRLKEKTGPFEVNAYEIHGVDYYFLPRGLFHQLDPDRFIVDEVRTDIQAIDMEQVRELLAQKNTSLIIAEVFHTLGRKLMEWVKQQKSLPFTVQSVFILPLSKKEIQNEAKRTGKKPKTVVYKTMKAKLKRRAEDSADKIEERAKSAYVEMQDACHYTHRIVNHAGEDARDQWGDPLGAEAKRVLNKFVSILRKP
jgi:guanylate kinase